MDPHISVIVTAYNRKKYLPDALRSLERQTLARDEFEVIVVKNFEDQASDEIIRRNGWRWIYSGEKAQGPFILAGLEESRGEIITFLEDDDMYAPERLQVIEKAFREIEGLAYFHNEQVIIDSDGKVIGDAEAGPDVMIEDPAKYCKQLFLDPGGFHNLSSIAVSARIVDILGMALRGASASADLVIMTIAAVAGQRMLLSGKRLTMWRVHGNSRSAYAYAVKEGEWRDAVAHLAWIYDIRAAAAAYVLELLGKHPCRPYAEHLELVRRLEASATPDWALQKRPKSSPLDFLRALHLRLSRKMEGGLGLMAVLAVDSVISKAPNQVRETWWRLRWRLGHR